MRLRIFPEIFVSFPDLHLGVTVARGIDNRGECAEIAELIRKKQAEISNKYAREGLEELARIQSWRRAYASFGAKPKKHRS
jgi:DNA/RNA-binding domain of Phe-tRNA-synthetase-like protein